MEKEKQTIVILQSKEEMELLREKIDISSGDIQVLAWTPSAVEGCIQNNILFTTTADYETEPFSSPQYFAKFLKLKEWCDILDSYIRKGIPDVERYQLRPFINSFASFKNPFFHYLDRIAKINAVIKKTQCQRIYYIRYPKPHESLLSDLIEVLPPEHAWRGIFEAVGTASESESGRQNYHLWGDPFLLYDRQNQWEAKTRGLLRRAKRGELSSFFSSLLETPLLQGKGVKNILILSEVSRFFKLEELLADLKKRKDLRFLFFDHVCIKKEALKQKLPDAFIDQMLQDVRGKELMICEGIDISPLFKASIEFILEQSLPFLIAVAKKFKKLNETFHFSLVISTYELTIWQPIFDQCEDLDIPVFLMTHGGCFGLSSQHVQIPLCIRGKKKQTNMKYFLYSPKSGAYCDSLKEYFPNYTAQNVILGTEYYQHLIRNNNGGCPQKDSKDINILYIYGAVGRAHCLFNGGVHAAAARYQLRYLVLDMLKGQKGINLYFKFGYDTETYRLDLEKQVMEKKWENIGFFSSSKPLTECFPFIDVFFVEGLETVLSEVLTTNKAIITLMDERGAVLDEVSKPLLSDRMTAVKSLKETEECLKDIIENRFDARIFKKNNKDDGFIKEFLTFEGASQKERFEEVFNAAVSEKK